METSVKRIMTIAVLATLLAACGEEPQAPAEPELAQEEDRTEARREVRRSRDREPEPEPIDNSDDPARKIPQAQAGLEEGEQGYGLTMIVDGSSPEAFQNSLELIAEDTSPEQYQRLDSALRYLKAYSSAGWDGPASLYQSLDGMTGEEIIERAAEEQQR